MNQRGLWSSPATRSARQARAEAFMGRPMELDGQPRVTANGGAAEVPGARRALETAERLRKSARPAR